MNCIIERGEIVIGRRYSEGNLQGQRGEKIFMQQDPNISFFHIEKGQRTRITHDLAIGKEQVLNIPLL